MMKKFKVEKKHLTGKIADFPLRVVQAMVDEQVRQGNPADPSVFARERTACKLLGGFTWSESALGMLYWAGIISWKQFYLIPKREKQSVEPHAIIQHMLDKGMVVWASLSDKSYDEARAKIGYYAYRVISYNTDIPYPVQTQYASWKYAVPINIATMTEITEVPK